MVTARVFPTKTSMSPTDEHAYFDTPDLFTQNYDEVHISVAFTWDLPKVDKLVHGWCKKSENVKVGGIAVEGESKHPFVSGMYLKQGVTITSRGCPNHCSFCMVNKGELIEFDEFPEGYIVNDNNILATSDHHWNLVMQMLKKQKGIEFKGGLESARLTEKKAEDLRSLRIKTMFLSADHKNSLKPLEKAVGLLLKAGFTRNHIQCYVLGGFDMAEEEHRLREVFRIGALPFCQLFRNREDSIKYSKEWKQFARRWSRPAIIKSMCNGETCQP